MKTIYCGILELDYKEGLPPMKTIYSDSLKHSNKNQIYGDFSNFLKLKKNVDLIFIEKEIDLEKIPNDPTPKFYSVYYNFKLEYQSDIYYEFLQIMKNMALYDKISYHLEFEFTDKEKNDSPLYFMATYFDFYGTNTKHPVNYGTEYQKTIVCSKCGTVRYQQTSPLYWNTIQLKKRLFMEIPSSRHTGGYSIIVAEKLANVLKDNYTGFTFEPVVHVGKQNNENKCYQMSVNSILPPLSDKMPSIAEDVCYECGKFATAKFPLHYDRLSLNNIKDFNFAYEEMLYPDFQPRLLVSPKVKNLFKELKIKPVWQPIMVVD